MDRGAHLRALGLGDGACYEEGRDAFRRQARATHPDLGGSTEAFAAVERAWAAVAPTLPRRPRTTPAIAVAPVAPVAPVVTADAPVPTHPAAADGSTPPSPGRRRATDAYRTTLVMPDGRLPLTASPGRRTAGRRSTAPGVGHLHRTGADSRFATLLQEALAG